MRRCFTALALSIVLSFTCLSVALAADKNAVRQNELTSTATYDGIRNGNDADLVNGTVDIEEWAAQTVDEFLVDHGWEIVNNARSVIEADGSVSQNECIDFGLDLLIDGLIDIAVQKDPTAATLEWGPDLLSLLVGNSITDINASIVLDTIFTSRISGWIKEVIGVELELPEYYADDIAFVNQLIRTYDLPADIASTDGAGVGMWVMSAFVQFDDSFPKRLKGIRMVSQNNNAAPVDFTDAKNLEWIFLSGNYIEISVKELPKLTSLEVRHDRNLKKVNAGGCVSLETLTCNTSQLEQLVVVRTPKLQKLEVQNPQMDSLKLAGCPNLKELICSNGTLKDLNIDALKHLITLNCSGNQLKSLDVAECGELEALNATSNQLESIAMGSALKSLRSVNLNKNKFTCFSLNNGRFLEQLRLNDNPLEQLSITNNTRLTVLQCGNSGSMTNVDIHGCTALKKIDGSLKGEFTYLNIENCVSLEGPLGFQLSHQSGMSPTATVININGCSLQISCEDHNGLEMLYSLTLMPEKGTVMLNGNTLDPPNIEIVPPLPLTDTTSWYNKAKEFTLDQNCTLVLWYGNRSATVQPDPSTGPEVKPAPGLSEVKGYQGGRVNERNYYVKASGASTKYYLRSTSGKMTRVAAPGVKAGSQSYYPVLSGSSVLFPRVENGKVTCYSEFQGGMEIPRLAVQAEVSPAITGGYQTGTVNGRTYYVKVSGASMKYYLKSSSGKMTRVAAPGVTSADKTRYYPINYGGTVLFPKLTDGRLTYTTESGEIVLAAV